MIPPPPPSGIGPEAAERKRRRDPEGHRSAILRAAQDAFTEKGYAQATIRDIARRAGVTHGLVMRQFVSKEKLFLAAVPGHRELPGLVDGDPATLAERIAAGFIHRLESNAPNDPLIALVRSAAAHEIAATRLADAMQEHSEVVYRSMVPGDDVDLRVALLGAQLIGVTFSRYVVKSGPLATASAEEAAAHLTRVLQHILFS